MISQVYAKKEDSSGTGNQKTAEIGNLELHTLINRNNYPDAFKATQAPVLSFDNPAHQRR